MTKQKDCQLIVLISWIKDVLSLFKFVDFGLFTANLVSSLNCYCIISDCKQVEMLCKQGCET